jgi:hypothetical protein
MRSESELKKTLHVHVGNRCLCPKVLFFLGVPGLPRPDFPELGFIGFFKYGFLNRHRRGACHYYLYEFSKKKASKKSTFIRTLFGPFHSCRHSAFSAIGPDFLHQNFLLKITPLKYDIC